MDPSYVPRRPLDLDRRRGAARPPPRAAAATSRYVVVGCGAIGEVLISFRMMRVRACVRHDAVAAYITPPPSPVAAAVIDTPPLPAPTVRQTAGDDTCLLPRPRAPRHPSRRPSSARRRSRLPAPTVRQTAGDDTTVTRRTCAAVIGAPPLPAPTPPCAPWSPMQEYWCEYDDWYRVSWNGMEWNGMSSVVAHAHEY